MALKPYATAEDRLWYYLSRAVCFAVLGFLVLPILIVAPISFTSGNLLAFPLPGFSLRWYESLVETTVWITAAKNSVVIGLASSALAMLLGTTAAMGLARSSFSLKPLIIGLVLSPVLVPIVITAVGIYFAFAAVGLSGTYLGLIIAHTVLSVPFVVITVTASLENFDFTLVRAANALGASPLTAFRRVTLPIVFPGIASGGLFAFATSFDEIVVTLFLAAPDQRTLPRQLFSGVREYVSPSIAAVATLLVILSALLLIVVQLLSRRFNRLSGRK
ncbi:ABC transporter permease [Aestuariivirga sp.]|uniref:ABC transporter permease n=1 Tax=Aestuariivirga sp. TaxID=2650926 RepID=UPI00391DE744